MVGTKQWRVPNVIPPGNADGALRIPGHRHVITATQSIHTAIAAA
jgi:hypothetical protein